jgi:tetratricopeptide (TPR) repeat protein
MKPKLCTALSLIALCVQCSSSPASHAIVARQSAFVDVAVVPMDTDRVLEHQTVLVSDGRITVVAPVAAVRVPTGSQRIDGRGRYLMPGLIDMHVHLRSATELPLYISNGVTTVFNLDGRPQHLIWRARIATGEMFGPAIYTVGPKFDKARTSEESVREVEAQSRAGYDGVKIYTRVSKVEYPALLAAARRNNMLVVGHVPREVGFEGTLQAGQALEHAEEYVYTFFNNTLDIDQLNFDETRIPEAVALTRASGIWFTPTLVTYDHIVQQADDLNAYLARPEMRFISPALREKLEPANNLYKNGFSGAQVPRLKQNLAFQKKLVAALHQGGVPMLAGTDAMGIGTVGGFSLHEELRNFVEAGFSPFEALQTATSNAAEFLKTSSDLGSVAVGKRADLILLNSNPLTSVDNAALLAGVMVRGRWYPGAKLRRVLAALPAAYEGEEQLVKTSLHNDVETALRYLDENDPFGYLASDVLTSITIENGPAELARIVGDIIKRHPGSMLVQEKTINALGYQLLRRKRLQDASEVLRLNVASYPKSANTYDSLAEAYSTAGEVGRAIENYRKALEVDANYPNAAFAVEFLKKHPGQ